MRNALVSLLKFFGLFAVFAVTTIIGFSVLIGVSWDMGPEAASAFRQQYQWAPLVGSVLTVFLYATLAFRQKPRRLNSLDILEEIDRQRRGEPSSAGKSLLKASRVDPVLRPDGTWLVYAGPQVGEVHYQQKKARYRHIPAVGDVQVHRDIGGLLAKLDTTLIAPRPARRAA